MLGLFFDREFITLKSHGTIEIRLLVKFMIKKLTENIKSKDLLIIGVIIFLNILPRLIYIFNSGFFIDGDEAIFGVMIRDFLDNGHLPLFFYGQNYGFVFFEVLLSSIISFFFGSNIFSIKIAMLIFWLMSMVILYYIGKKIFTSRRWAFLSVLLISFTPVWFDWATKARGGYLTALLLSNIVIWLAVSKKNIFRLITISLSLILIYYAQPLWVVVTAPFIALYLAKDFKLKYTAVFAVSSLLFLAISRFLLAAISLNYQPQNKLGFGQLTLNLKNIFNYYYTAHSGRFFDVTSLKMNHLSSLVSTIFIIILTLVVIYDIYLFLRNRLNKIDTMFLFSVIAYLLFMLFYSGEEYPYRYLLPIFIPSIFLIILTIKRTRRRWLNKSIYIFLIIYTFFSLVGGIFSYNFVFPQIKDGYTEVERIESLEKFLQMNTVRCVYALDWIISQHVNYFMPGIRARHQDIDSRRPQDSVKADLYQQSNECALVGLWYQLPLFTRLYKLNDIYVINNRYIVHLRPQKDDLLKLNFKLTN